MDAAICHLNTIQNPSDILLLLAGLYGTLIVAYCDSCITGCPWFIPSITHPAGILITAHLEVLRSFSTRATLLFQLSQQCCGRHGPRQNDRHSLSKRSAWDPCMKQTTPFEAETGSVWKSVVPTSLLNVSEFWRKLLVGGWTNPFEIISQIGSSSPSRGENKQKIETTT